jgi:hypothetical protein
MDWPSQVHGTIACQEDRLYEEVAGTVHGCVKEPVRTAFSAMQYVHKGIHDMHASTRHCVGVAWYCAPRTIFKMTSSGLPLRRCLLRAILSSPPPDSLPTLHHAHAQRWLLHDILSAARTTLQIWGRPKFSHVVEPGSHKLGAEHVSLVSGWTASPSRSACRPGEDQGARGPNRIGRAKSTVDATEGPSPLPPPPPGGFPSSLARPVGMAGIRTRRLSARA